MVKHKRISFGGIVFVLLLALLFSSCGVLNGEVTVHEIGCDGEWKSLTLHDGNCLGKLVDLSVTYKALVDKQEVLYWGTDDKSEIRKFHKCNVRDWKNWDCEEIDGLKHSMRNGDLIEANTERTYHASWMDYHSTFPKGIGWAVKGLQWVLMFVALIFLLLMLWELIKAWRIVVAFIFFVFTTFLFFVVPSAVSSESSVMKALSVTLSTALFAFSIYVLKKIHSPAKPDFATVMGEFKKIFLSKAAFTIAMGNVIEPGFFSELMRVFLWVGFVISGCFSALLIYGLREDYFAGRVLESSLELLVGIGIFMLSLYCLIKMDQPPK